MKEEEKNHETTGKKTTLTDKIYQDIKDDILTKVFQPGEKLNLLANIRSAIPLSSRHCKDWQRKSWL